MQTLQTENLAFIDGQNLYMGTSFADEPWKVDFFRFRRYLKEKYKVKIAYYYIGYALNEHRSLYALIQEAGFVLIFRKYNSAMLSQKKGNVDSDIIFDVMKKLYKKEPFDKVILVSGDGDYCLLVDFLIEENCFEKILFPNKRYASSLYKQISDNYFIDLGRQAIRKKIGIQQKKKRVA